MVLVPHWVEGYLVDWDLVVVESHSMVVVGYWATTGWYQVVGDYHRLEHQLVVAVESIEYFLLLGAILG